MALKDLVYEKNASSWEGIMVRGENLIKEIKERELEGKLIKRDGSFKNKII